MPYKIFLLAFLTCCLSCQPDDAQNKEGAKSKKDSEAVFDRDKWALKAGLNYPHREAMLDDVMNNQNLRHLDKAAILEKLGPPDRENENYLYYRIKQQRAAFWPLHTKTLVVVLSTDSTAHKLLIHE